jgi:cyclopropane fatty-acyl-phospholipid synthase-like methyltransferase
MNTTIEYFDEKAEHCFADAFTITERSNQDRFLAELPTGGSILDLGCGSGRDTAYFREKGFTVTPTDGSARMCELASDYLGTPCVCRSSISLTTWPSMTASLPRRPSCILSTTSWWTLMPKRLGR